jgi:hypothetical protein
LRWRARAARGQRPRDPQANSVDTNKRLRKTYNPTNVASVRRFDEARTVGARLLEQNRSKSVTPTALVTLLKERKSAKPLK